MKTIIAYTDFTASATNAVQYAAALATALKARLVLFHHFTYPVPATDFPEVYPTIFMEDMVGDFERKLQQVKEELALSYPVEMDCVVRSLSMPEDLEEVFAEQSANLVVMGMEGHNAVLNALFGNVTSMAIRRGSLPLLVVPQGVVFHPLQKILFPCDDQTIPGAGTLEPLRDLALAFDAHIEVLTLLKTPAPDGDTLPAKSDLDSLLDGIRHDYAYRNETAVDKGILYEAADSAADLVAMIPHHHSFWSALLNQSETQRVAANIMLPLLVLAEKVT